MTKDNRNIHRLAAGVLASALISPALADTGAKAMQAEVGDKENMTAAEAAAEQAAAAKAFQDDMARMSAHMNAQRQSTAAATAVDGTYSQVLDPSKFKTLMVKKNSDGTFTIGHVDAESVEHFLAIDGNPNKVEEE